jgi:hypothetical protein
MREWTRLIDFHAKTCTRSRTRTYLIIMKSIIFILLILTCNVNRVKSQNIIPETPTQVSVFPPTKQIDYRIPIIKALGKHMDIDRLLKSPKNHAHVFSISLAFNAEGKIDSIYFNENMSSNLKEIINSGSNLYNLSKALNSIKFNNEFTNKIALLPIVLKRWEDQEIDNAGEFLSDLSALWPRLKLKDKSKQVVFLEPFVNHYSTIN